MRALGECVWYAFPQHVDKRQKALVWFGDGALVEELGSDFGFGDEEMYASNLSGPIVGSDGRAASAQRAMDGSLVPTVEETNNEVPNDLLVRLGAESRVLNWQRRNQGGLGPLSGFSATGGSGRASVLRARCVEGLVTPRDCTGARLQSRTNAMLWYRLVGSWIYGPWSTSATWVIAHSRPWEGTETCHLWCPWPQARLTLTVKVPCWVAEARMGSDRRFLPSVTGVSALAGSQSVGGGRCLVGTARTIRDRYRLGRQSVLSRD